MEDKLKQPLSLFEMVFIAFLWLGLVAAWLFMDWAVLMQSTGSTDDTMRLHVVRDLLAGQGWFAGLHETRLAPPEGLDSHWSRVVDVPISILIVLARFFVDNAAAESFAMVAWPALLFLALMAGFVAIGRRLAPHSNFMPFAAAVIGCLQISHLFRPTALDHHNLQLVLSLWVLVCALWMNIRPAAAFVGGVLAALMLAVGLESIHIYAALNLLIVYRGMREPQQYRQAALRFFSTQAIALALLLPATVPPQLLFKPMCDALAINGAWSGIGACAVAALVLWRGSTWSFARQALVFLGGVAVVGAVAIAMEPLCLGGPNAMVNPRAIEVWMNQVTEAKDLVSKFQEAPDSIIPLVIYPLLALLCLAVLHMRKGLSSAMWTIFACVLLATAVTFMQVRGSSYSAMFGALFLATAAAKLLPDTIVGRVLRILVAGALPFALGLAGTKLLQPAAPEASDRSSPLPVSKPTVANYCAPRWGFPGLATEPTGIVLAHIDMGPALLLHSQHKVMLAPYHRTSDTIVEGFDLMASPVESVLGKLVERGITHLAECTATVGFLPDPDGRTDKSPILQDVMRGHISVDWLEALPADPQRPQIKLWRIKPPTHG